MRRAVTLGHIHTTGLETEIVNMTTLRAEFVQAVRALESAYLADKIAYVGLPRRSKDFWALQPPRSWPNTADFAPWMRARTNLLAAEARVIELLRQRTALAIKRRQQRRAARKLAAEPYVEQIVETVPDDLRLTDFLNYLTPTDAPPLAPFLRVQ